MMPFSCGYADSRPWVSWKDFWSSSLPYATLTSFMFLYCGLLSSSFMYLIHVFWFVRKAIFKPFLICAFGFAVPDDVLAPPDVLVLLLLVEPQAARTTIATTAVHAARPRRAIRVTSRRDMLLSSEMTGIWGEWAY